MKKFFFSLCTVLIIAAGSNSPAIDGNHIQLGSHLMTGWVPEKPVLRGAIVINGFPADSRWREAAHYWNFAILRIVTDGYTDKLDDATKEKIKQNGGKYMPYAAMIQHGLETLGERTGHPELAHVPLVLTGYSRFSRPIIESANLFPQRTLGLLTWTIKADQRQNPTFSTTPSMSLLCGWENIYHPGNKTDILKPWRRGKDLPRMASVTWRVYHNPHNRHDLGAIFIDQLINERIPNDWDPRSGPAHLSPIDLTRGWMGGQDDWYVTPEAAKTTRRQGNENLPIAPVASFTGNPDTSSWLLNETVAWAWRAHNARNPAVVITSPGQATVTIHEGKSPPPTAYQETGVTLGVPFTITATAMVDNVKEIEFFANTRSLGLTAAFTGGQTPLGSTQHATASIVTQIDQAGCYAIMARYTLDDGKTGWTRCFPLFVHPNDR